MATKKEEAKFNPLKNQFSSQLIKMSNDQLAKRYLTKNLNIDINKELDTCLNDYYFDENNVKNNKYPKIAAIQGPNLDKFCNTLVFKIDNTLKNEGYRLNIRNICEDFEKILQQSPKEVFINITTATELTPYVAQICNFFSKLVLKKAFLKETEDIFSQD